jgi:hypothetical protein
MEQWLEWLQNIWLEGRLHRLQRVQGKDLSKGLEM